MLRRKTGKSCRGYYEATSDAPTTTCPKWTRWNKTNETGFKEWKGWSSGWKNDNKIRKIFMPKMTPKMIKWTTTMTIMAIKREYQKREIIIMRGRMKRMRKRRIMVSWKKNYRYIWWIPFPPLRRNLKSRLLVSWLWNCLWWVERVPWPGWIISVKSHMIILMSA